MDVRARFDDFSRRLVDSVRDDSNVVGLVLLGSTADTERVDIWSDHDFFLLVTAGLEDEYRTDLTWLPDVQRIAFAVRESQHGLKVVYDDGAVLEFAVASVADAATFGGSPQRVVLDRGGVAQALTGSRTLPVPVDDLTRFRLFLSLVLIGVGRARRGEELAGGQLVRTWATEHLIWLFRSHPPLDDPSSTAEPWRTMDAYNPWRRFENAYPRLGAELGAALSKPCEPCGLDLLDLADRHLRPRWDGYPDAEVRTIRRALHSRISSGDRRV